MMSNAEIAIIGGGAAGCAAAYWLSLAGARCVLIEREGVAAFASGYSAGGLNPLEGDNIPGALAPLATRSFNLHKEIWGDLAERSGLDFEPKVTSSIRVALDEGGIADLRASHAVFSAAGDGFSAEWLDAAQLRELEPRITRDAIRALDARGNAILSSLRYTRALAESARTLGCRIVSAEVVGVAVDGDKIVGVNTRDETIPCAAAVFATGPWAADVENWLGVPVPIEPWKGEIVRTLAPSGPLSADFHGADIDLNHREGGQVWVGATEERRGFDLSPSQSGRDSLIAAARLMPEMARAEIVRHTVCLRPLSADGLPIIGEAPGWRNAYLATGAGKKGILLSPAIGKAIADLITDGHTDLPTAGFGPERFASHHPAAAPAK